VRLAGPVVGHDRAAALAEQTWERPSAATSIDVRVGAEEEIA
jgi:hypothetical protein